MIGIYFYGQNIPEWIQKATPKVEMTVGCPILVAWRYKKVTHILNPIGIGATIYSPGLPNGVTFQGAPTYFHLNSLKWYLNKVLDKVA